MSRLHRLGLAIEDQAPLPKRPVRVLGIDLGTTNSTVCEMRYDPFEREVTIAAPVEIEQQVLGDAIRGALVPSIVAVVNGQPIVGHAAARFRAAPAEYHLKEDATLFFETKNLIGLGKTYQEAPEGYRSPAEIAGHVLRMLYENATVDGPVDRVVVTAPASFETRQREETVRGAAIAGIDLAPGDLLDEPVAIFIESMMNESSCCFGGEGHRNVLVFDYGGGTCDVAVIALTLEPGSRPKVSPLAVSRYHRLGGGDFDRAIVYEALIPQILDQSGLDAFAIDFDTKRYALEPALVPVAERLKVMLSSDRSIPTATLHRTIRIEHEGASLRLKNPSLSREQFDELLEPFVDREMTWESGNEYRSQLSIFAPIEDALDRAGLEMDEIDVVLLAGGGTLVPGVVKAIDIAFPKATVEFFSSPEDAQTAVARGAAYHAMSVELFGRGMVRPTAHEAISIRTSAGLVEIVPKGTELPYPKLGQWESVTELATPADCANGALELRVEVVAGSDRNLLESRIWNLPAPVKKNEPLEVLASLDENKLLQIMLVPSDRDANPFSLRIENPITHVVNPGEVRMRIEQTERELDQAAVAPSAMTDRLTNLAKDYAEIGYREKALDRFRRAMKMLGRSSSYILNQMGMVAGDMGDRQAEEKYYLEAALADTTCWIPLFNLALTKQMLGDLDEASRHINAAIARKPNAPCLVFKARIMRSTGDQAAFEQALDRAKEEFAPVETLSLWELHWFEKMASMRDDSALVERARAARRALAGSKHVAPVERGVLPDQRQQSVAVGSGSVN